MSVLSVIQDVASVLNVVVLAIGYYFLVKLYREWVSQWKEERAAGGRPQVVVTADYSHLPDVNVVVRNFTKAPAKDVTFHFSAPIQNQKGTVLSDLPFFEKGLPFLEPEGEIRCYWGSMPSLVPLLEEKELEEGIKVTTRYKDLAEESYESQWTLNPLLFKNAPMEASRGMNDLVKAVEKIPKDLIGWDRRGKQASGEGGGDGPA